MALEARGLGFDSLVAMGIPAGREISGITVLAGTVVQGAPAGEAIARAKRSRGEGKVVFVRAQDNGFNRAVLGAKGIHVLCGLGSADRHAFDHVAATIAADHGVAVDISLEPLVRQRGIARQKALGRYFDILMLSRKHGFPLVISTHARSVLEMRPVREIAGIASLIGLSPGEAGQGLAAIGQILVQKESVRVVP
jgi:ribonuclease P/MRP protein subunit RPP1